MTPLLVALFALIPAASTWWFGQTLIALADDPALPERLMAGRGKTVLICAVSLALLFTFGFEHLAWSLPLLIVARMCAAYTIRKALYRDAWSVGGYLSFFIRLIVAGYGFWAALSLMPAVAGLAGSRDWIVAGLAAAVLGAWSAAYGRVFSAIMRGKAVTDPPVQARFDSLVRQCGLRNVVLEQVDMRGGVFANAVALPSITHPLVLMTSTLVERLDADETAAILAHELAHIEQYNPRVLRAMARTTWALIAAGAVLAPLARLTMPQDRGPLSMLWPAAVVVTLAVRARHRQKRETESDVRAVELTGNADALIRALTKLHAFARIPRRWDTDVEQHASHPSLARRIQAIHQAAGSASAPLAGPASFAAADGTRSITFHADRLEFNEPAGSHAMAYGLLMTLRIEARTAAPCLVAVDASRRRWTLALQPADLARAQATLDAVDSRLGTAPSPAGPIVLPRLVAIIAVVISVLGGQIAVALVAWLATLEPASSLIGAAGAAAIAAAGLVWRDHVASIPPDGLIALALLVAGVVLIVLQAMQREHHITRRARLLTAALAVAAASGCTLMLASGTDALALHHGAQEWASTAVLLAGLAGALAFSRSVKVRCAAAALAGAGCGVMFLGSTAFLTRFVDDPFLVETAAIAFEPVAATPATEVTVPFTVNRLLLSPDGRYMALAAENREERITIHAGPTGGPFTELDADEAGFVDETRLLLLERRKTSAVLRLIDMDQHNREVWSRQIPLWSGRLSFSRRSQRWQVLGWNEAGDLAGVDGRIGVDSVREQAWKTPGTETDEIEPLAVSNGTLIAVENRFVGGLPTGALQLWAAAMMRSTPRSQSELWTIGPQGRRPLTISRLPFDCRKPSLDEPVICAAFDGTQTGFFAIEPGTGRPAAQGSVGGHFYLHGDADRGWLAGWLGGRLVLINPSARAAIRIPSRQGTIDHIAAVGDTVIGSVSSRLHASTVRVYRHAPTSARR